MSNVTLDTLTRAEAHRKLLALGMSADVAADYLDSEASLTASLALSLACPGAWPILEAYQRHCAARTDHLDTVPEEELAALPVNSIGTCLLCNYHGPGPGHDCKPRIARPAPTVDGARPAPGLREADRPALVAALADPEVAEGAAAMLAVLGPPPGGCPDGCGAAWLSLAPTEREPWQRVARALDASRPGLTEEEALATAGPLSRDIYNRIGLTTGNKIGAPEWMRDAIAAALLRAAPAPASALPIDHPGVRDALRALAVAMCATQARDPEQKAQLQRVAEAHDALRYALGDKDPAAEDAILPVRFPGHVAVPRFVLSALVDATQHDESVRKVREAAERILHLDALRYEPARTDPEAARALADAQVQWWHPFTPGMASEALCSFCGKTAGEHVGLTIEAMGAVLSALGWVRDETGLWAEGDNGCHLWNTHDAFRSVARTITQTDTDRGAK